MIVALLLSCSEPDSPPRATSEIPSDQATIIALDAPKLLRRISLDLRGILPSLAELEEVDTDPARVDSYVEDWMDDPRFEERLVHLLNERWHTRIDDFLVFYLEYPELSDDAQNEYPFERSVGEEPLRLIANIVAQDKPWTEVVTADYTMANDILGEIWPIDHPGGTGWQPAQYTDGRPAAGVLSTNGLWWRYYSTISNYNRARVAALTRLLICEDYTTRSISFSEETGVTEVEDLESALRNNPYCMGCHSAIDPIAATLFGFWPANEYQVDEIHTYHPDREPLGPDVLEVEPAWYGQPVYGLNELGQTIAADGRFSQCAVQTFASLLWRREADSQDFQRLQDLHESFLEAEYSAQQLIADVLSTPEYTAGGSTHHQERERVVRLLTTDQMASVVEDLTGYVWTQAGYEQLDNDTLGFRNLAGGVDGHYITSPQQTPSLTRALTVQRLAEAASQVAVNEEFNLSSPNRRLLPGITELSVPGDASFDAVLEDLHFRFYGERATSDWVSSIGQLWTDLHQDDTAQMAWSGVLTAMFRDVRFESY